MRGPGREALLTLLLCLAAASGGCRRRPPGPNDAYRDPRVSAQVWNHFFEDDGRGEIYRQRELIVKLAGARPA